MTGAVRTRRNPTAARARILDAAAAEFAAFGYAGARVDRIAGAAGLNKRMLYHYFIDKRGLHRAVLERCRSRSAAAPEPQSGRLLLWAILEPTTAADLREILGPEAPRVLETGLAELATRLFGDSVRTPAGPRPKPRIRLRRPDQRRASSAKRSK